MDGSRLLYGYQLKEGKSIPSGSELDTVFRKSFLIRGQTTQENTTVRSWHSVSDQELEDFFGVPAVHWSAKQWKKLHEESENAASLGTSKMIFTSESLLFVGSYGIGCRMSDYDNLSYNMIMI